MAVERTVTKQVFYVVLNNGTSATGTMKTLNLSIGTLSAAAGKYDDDKCLAIAGLLEAVLAKAVVGCKNVTTSSVEDDGED